MNPLVILLLILVVVVCAVGLIQSTIKEHYEEKTQETWERASRVIQEMAAE